MYLEITFLAFVVDKIVGEFSFIRHPVILMGDFIKYYEKKIYTDNIINGN